ncbi:MAG: P-loop NTPase [Proteobacteria bacterium]|nr:P-loop NTPase [Pseudomonadota bacterium]
MALIYPIGGGKGGVGKSFVTANLGVLLANQGYSVAIVDLDLGGSNLHTFFGLNKSKNGINRFLNQDCKTLEETAEPTAVNNLFIINSFNSQLGISNLFSAQKLKIINAIQKLPFDFVLLDLGAGTNYNTIDFFLSSDKGMFVCIPEPTSIENTFRFINAVYLRKLQHLLKQRAFNAIVLELSNGSKNAVIKAYDIVHSVIRENPQKGEKLKSQLDKLEFKFVINQFRKSVDKTIGFKIEKTCNRHFYSRFQFLGNISYDERVHNSVVARTVYMEKYAYTLTAIDLLNIAKKLTGVEQSTVRVTEDCYETV